MWDKKHNVIWFPHFIPTNKIDGREITFNDINGGMKQLSDFKDEKGEVLERNNFVGGNITQFGLIKEYGFYACPIANDIKTKVRQNAKKIFGFYVDKGSDLTEKGKKAIRNRFPKETAIVWEGKPEFDTEESLREDAERKRVLLQEISDMGYSPNKYARRTVEELQDAIKILESGKTGTSVEVSQTGVATAEMTPEEAAANPPKAKTKATSGQKRQVGRPKQLST